MVQIKLQASSTSLQHWQ